MTREPPTLAGTRSLLRALRAGDACSLQRHADDEAVWHRVVYARYRNKVAA